MKKLLSFVFLFIVAYSNATHIQINFISNFEISVENNYFFSPSEGTETSDYEMNLIFSKYGIHHIIEDFTSSNKIIFADYTGNNIDNLLNDLSNNANVLRARICPDLYRRADSLYLELIDLSIGNSIGVNSNGNIKTTNEDLNLIFDNHGVKSMGKLSPNLSYYFISLEGNIVDLIQALQNLKTVITNVETIGIVMLLHKNSFESGIVSVSPNPFLTNFTINSTENVSEYLVFDLSGKQILKGQSKSDLETQSYLFAPGIYLLKLKFDNGKHFSYKLIKK